MQLSVLCIHVFCRQDVHERAFCRVSLKNKERDFSNYVVAKCSVCDVHHLQTYHDSPSTFLESSVSFKNTFLAPLGKEKAPLIFPSK